MLDHTTVRVGRPTQEGHEGALTPASAQTLQRHLTASTDPTYLLFPRPQETSEASRGITTAEV